VSQDVHGILLLDKPLGLTSAAAVARVKRLYAANKAGHMGSLDPLATGLLVIGLGEATKFGAHLLDADKTYRVKVRLGERTASGDQETPVCERASVPSLDREQMIERLARFPRHHTQVPPMHSALKRNGKPLYLLARAGQTVVRNPREVTLNDLRVLDWNPPDLTFEVSVSKGTYIRTLAEDIAIHLSSLGHLAALRRLSVMPFEQPSLHEIGKLEGLGMEERPRLLLPVDSALLALPSLTLDVHPARLLGCGQAVAAGKPVCDSIRIYGAEGRFLGLGSVDSEGFLRPRRLLAAHDS